MSARNGKPSFAQGLVVAVVSSFAGAAVLAALTPLAGFGLALRATIALLAFAYVLYLLTASGERVGRVTTVVLWLVAAGVVWFVHVPLAGYVLFHAGLLWLVRSLYFSSNLPAALVDLGVLALGIAFAAWAAGRSGSALLALWCFFLAQAFHVLIPAVLARPDEQPPTTDDRAFRSAQRAAEAALRRMSAAR
jgi:hypothetical protein